MRGTSLSLICSLSLSLSFGAEGQGVDDSTSGTEVDAILMIEPMDIAFYESAPRRMVHLMRETARQRCVASGGTVVRKSLVDLPDETLYWLCDGSPLRFFTGVQIDGTKTTDGYICNAKTYPGVRYNLPRHIHTAGGCVYFVHSERTQKFEIWVNPED
jgi:hypothetical protein